jgi:CDP-glucose 4,6-dehydratase
LCIEIDSFWHGKRVFLTGHTGFKGGWLSLWLASMGAEVHGYALEPVDENNFYSECSLGGILAGEVIADIRNSENLQTALNEAQPEIVIHMAAQALVRDSYVAPVETYSINVMGTVNLLQAVRSVDSVKSVINVTTDKCYLNREWVWPYREDEPLGGHDPYSSSKACSELVTSAFRSSFLQGEGIALASTRAGNVIGGGDWTRDRLIPDVFKSIFGDNTLVVRSPNAVRPWQHVLEPLSGYLELAKKLHQEGQKFAEAWNFGPEESDAKSVNDILAHLQKTLPRLTWTVDISDQPHEANFLMLSSSKAKSALAWRPKNNLATTLDMTASWYRAWNDGENMRQFSVKQISEYLQKCPHYE